MPRRMPRPSRGRLDDVIRRIVELAGYLLVGETATDHLAHDLLEAVRIVFVLAVVEAKGLLVKVTKEMEGFNAHIGSAQAALQEAPEVFESVGVNLPVYIRYRMVDDLMSVLGLESVIRFQVVAVKCCTRFDVLPNFSLKCFLLSVINYSCADVAAALKNPHHGDFILWAATGYASLSLRKVHVAGLATDEGFIHLNFPAHLHEGASLHGVSDSMEHEPCGLLSDAQIAGDLVAADSVLAVYDEPDGGHPLVHSEGAILEDGPNLHGELLLAGVAVPDAASRDEGVPIRAASWASDLAIGPAQLDRIGEAAVSIREVGDCLLQGFGFFGGVHVHSLSTSKS
jgi:hypothetical protein